MTLSNTADLAAYFRRIGFGGSASATLETVTELVARHTETIPFENTDPFLGTPVRLDAKSIQDKLVHGGRGGYCFEHNLLVNAVLTQLGFEVRPLSARVVWGQPIDTIGQRSHMLLQVHIDDGLWLVDTGFGGMTPTAPLRFELDIEQQTPHETFRLIEYDGDFMLQAYVGGKWRPIYRFDLQRQYPFDYEAPNWYLSTSPESHFVSRLMGARPAPGKRFALSGRTLTVHHTHGDSKRTQLASADDFGTVLIDDFGLTGLPSDRITAAFDALPVPDGEA